MCYGFADASLGGRPDRPGNGCAALRLLGSPAGSGLAAGGLLAASLAVFLAPLWTLGPQTALEMWARVMAAGTTAGLPALLAAIPALADALGAVLSGTPGTRPALAGALLASGATFAILARRLSRRPSRLSRAFVGTPR